MKSALLIAHGSRSLEAFREIENLAREIKQASGLKIVHFAFLEASLPDIPSGIKRCIQDGASEILILLHFLNSGNHVRKDIPSHIETATRKHPGVRFHLTGPVGLSPLVVRFYQDWIQKVL